MPQAQSIPLADVKTPGARDPVQTHCAHCRLSGLCLPLALESHQIEQLDTIIQRGRPLQRGAHLYREKEGFHAVYAVRSGSIKAYTTAEDGTEQVTGFYFPGEILGMDGISTNRHASSAMALETTAVCEIPFNLLGELSIRLPSLQRHFFQLMSREITEDQQLITLLSRKPADARVAALLLSISTRHARRALSATRFRLPMSRRDIGNYLGLTVETVSRVFSRLQREAVIAANKREVELLEREKLQAIAAAHC
jgi:CRP/FNR family transcriptional regulator